MRKLEDVEFDLKTAEEEIERLGDRVTELEELIKDCGGLL